jgi:hypothetical protein
MVDFSPAELEFLRVILDAILHSETRQITQTAALFKSSFVRIKKVTQQVKLDVVFTFLKPFSPLQNYQ